MYRTYREIKFKQTLTVHCLSQATGFISNMLVCRSHHQDVGLTASSRVSPRRSLDVDSLISLPHAQAVCARSCIP